MDGQSSSNISEPPFRPGSIRSIKLINFMCHESFELNFGSRVNFVIGPNGSGKSALLTALVVALGGRATITSRAKKTSDFIMNNKNYARISIVLHNWEKVMDRHQAFKPDEYGRHITIEKVIYKDDASKLTLKNEKDKKISERKQELDEMLDHFGILINNPICILNQEVSKTFLHSKRPEDKFELFIKATNLEQIEQDYFAANLAHKEWEESNTQKSIGFKLLDNEYHSCKEKVGFLENRFKLRETLDKLHVEHIWAIVRDNEELSEQFQKKVREITESINIKQQEVDERLDKIKNHEEDIQLMKHSISSINEQSEEKRKKIQEIRSKELTVRAKQIETKQKVDAYQRKILKYSEDRVSLEKAISDLRKQFRDQNGSDLSNEQRKLDIERLERELKAEAAKEISLRLHTEQLSNSMTSTRGDMNAANMKVGDLDTSLKSKRALVSRLRNGQDNALRKYGDFVVKIREEIESSASQFKRKPLGPLGYYLKLKSPDIAPALECHLGRSAHAFVCDNHDDMTTLMGIFRKVASCARDFRHPMIITRPFRPRHDVSRFKAHHDTYKTLLDYLEIENDTIFNVLVDRSSIESVLFIPNYREAENLMINPSLVPRNTRCAYTKDCAVMHPRTVNAGYKSFANDPTRFALFSENNLTRIQQEEREIEQLSAKLRVAENAARTIKDGLDAQKSEFVQNMAESRRLVDSMREKEEQLLNLKTTITKEPQEMSCLESDLESVISQINAEKLNVERYTQVLESVKTELENIVKQRESYLAVQKEHESKRIAVLKIVEETKASIALARTEIGRNKIIIENRAKDKEKEMKKLDEALEKLSRSKLDIQSDKERPNVIRKTELVAEEERKIQNQLRVEQEEMRDPDEVIAGLKKRCEEIEDLTQIKDSNLRIFDKSTKTLNDRKEGFLVLQRCTINAVTTTFSAVMRTMKMNGELQINLHDLVHRGEVIKKAKTLEMKIETNYTPSQRANLVMNDNNNNNASANNAQRLSRSQPDDSVIVPPRAKRARRSGNNDADPVQEKENGVRMTDARSLSGGERSFSTVAFVLALWHHCLSPFKLMDEIDVFMDMVTRRVSYNALIRFAQCTENAGQFVFFSPLELPKIDEPETSSVRVFEMPANKQMRR